MISYHPNAERIAAEYIDTNVKLKPLGWGVDGVVYPSPDASTAVKIHSREEPFARELAAYERLKRRNVTEFQGFNVPRLVRSDERLLVIEMSIVRVPCLIDFAATTLDKKPDFSSDAITTWVGRSSRRLWEEFRKS